MARVRLKRTKLSHCIAMALKHGARMRSLAYQAVEYQTRMR